MGDPSKKRIKMSGAGKLGSNLEGHSAMQQEEKDDYQCPEGTHNGHQESAVGRGNNNGIRIVANIY